MVTPTPCQICVALGSKKQNHSSAFHLSKVIDGQKSLGCHLKAAGKWPVEFHVLQNKCKTITNHATLDLVILYSHYSFIHHEF